MPMLTVRNLPDDVHRALRARASRNGRSTEAEVREILKTAVAGEVRLGGLLADIGRRLQLTDQESATFDSVRDTTPPRMVDLDDPA